MHFETHHNQNPRDETERDCDQYETKLWTHLQRTCIHHIITWAPPSYDYTPDCQTHLTSRFRNHYVPNNHCVVCADTSMRYKATKLLSTLYSSRSSLDVCGGPRGGRRHWPLHSDGRPAVLEKVRVALSPNILELTTTTTTTTTKKKKKKKKKTEKKKKGNWAIEGWKEDIKNNTQCMSLIYCTSPRKQTRIRNS